MSKLEKGTELPITTSQPSLLSTPTLSKLPSQQEDPSDHAIANPAISNSTAPPIEEKTKKSEQKISAFNSFQQQRTANNDDSLKQLSELLLLLDEFPPLIPDQVTDFYLERAGFQCDDVRLKRVIALATQKFISDIINDSFHYCKIRQQATKRNTKERVKSVLTMDDLSAALAENGVNIKKPEYFQIGIQLNIFLSEYISVREFSNNPKVL